MRMTEHVVLQLNQRMHAAACKELCCGVPCSIQQHVAFQQGAEPCAGLMSPCGEW